jgi:hypothetical protein
MDLFPTYIELKETSRTYRRFEFAGRCGPAHCYLKIDIRNDVIVFFCVQLINYYERAINEGGAEMEIRRRAILRLMEEGAMVSTRPRLGLDRFLSQRFNDKRLQDAIDLVDERSLWVRFIPAEEHFQNRNTYALFDLKDHFIRFLSLDEVVDATRLDRSFFDVPVRELICPPLELEGLNLSASDMSLR